MPVGDWERYFRDPTKLKQRLTINENETIVLVYHAADTLILNDSLTVAQSTGGSNLVGTALVGFAEAG